MSKGYILITGSAKHLGRAIALKLAALGYPLLCHYKTSESQAESLVQACRALGVETLKIYGDFSTPDGMAAFIKELKQRKKLIYGLINNVGVFTHHTLSECSDQSWFELFNSNLHTPFLLTRELMADLIENQGRVINIGHAGIAMMRAHNLGLRASGYWMTKVALLAFTRLAAAEFAPKGVTVNMVSPGHLPHSVDEQHRLLPMQRVADYEEVVEAIIFLLKSASGYITGQNIEVAGGVGL